MARALRDVGAMKTPAHHAKSRATWILLLAAAAYLLAAGAIAVSGAQATTVKDLARLKGQGDSVVVGVGLVVGLSGTGDSGKELAMARPLAELLKNGGVTVGSLKELAASKSVALVTLSCTIPENGGRTDDKFDVYVSVAHSASSLKGGRLVVAPLTSPRRGGEVYAMAEGPISIDDQSVPTAGRVRMGARLVRDVLMEPVGDTFDLILQPVFAGYASASQIAISIDGLYRTDPQAQAPSIARVIDDRTVRIMIPPAERADRAAFIADVLSTDVNVALLRLPAMVVCNRATGAIVVTADVEISPAAITHKDLVITTTIPQPVPTPQDPMVDRKRWTGVSTAPAGPGNARLADLLAAFKQLDIQPADQIDILHELYKAGKLQAKLVID